MATIENRGGKWRARVRMHGAPALSGTFSSERAARAWARSMEAKIRASGVPDLIPASASVRS